MAHLYAVIVRDDDERGFDTVASELGWYIDQHGRNNYKAEFVSNPLTPEQGDDFHAIVIQSGRVLDSLDAENEPRGEAENVKGAVDDATSLLAAIRHRVEYELDAEAEEALETALDAWDRFVQRVNVRAIGAEHGDSYPGIHWPTRADCTLPPDGWSWVERCDEADIYEDDEEAAYALIKILGERRDADTLPNFEVRWFDRETHEPTPDNEYHSGASVAINVPESFAWITPQHETEGN